MENLNLSVNVNDNLIDYLSELSLLNFEKDDKLSIKQDLNELIKFCDIVKKIPDNLLTTNNSKNIFIESNTRKNDISKKFDKSLALKNAQLKDKDFFLVPKVIDK